MLRSDPKPLDSDEPVVGLVLSSGAARGAAHVGVLTALAELGVEPDLVVGTSSGALIGGAWAAGLPPELIAERVLTATWSDFGRPRPTRALAVIETTALRANLESVFGGRRIEDLPHRFGAVATDLRRRQPVLLDHGDAAQAVQASIAVPGVFPAVRGEAGLLVDGVLTSPLAVWAAYALGATCTIGVRLRPEAPRPGPSEVVRRLIVAPVETVRPDVEILVDTTGYASWSTRDVPDLVELGHRATCDALSSSMLRRLLGVANVAG
jgi:NTE family protein